MKTIKKTFSIFVLALVFSIGITQLTTTSASACNPPHHDYTYFQLDSYPGIIFDTSMVNQHSGHVYNIQWMLNRIGYGTIDTDGYYGENTANAVRAFQTAHRNYLKSGPLEADGVVGPQTWTALKAHCY